jgi:uncharacterized membrane protein
METTARSIVKALSWRAIATMITTVLVYLLTGEAAFAAKIGLADTSIKLFVYFSHERLWNRIPFGKAKTEPEYFI